MARSFINFSFYPFIMVSAFFDAVYDSWKPKQLAKYQQLLPLFKQHLRPSQTLLDYGIGPGWLEEFFLEHHFSFQRIVGFDVNPLVVNRQVPGVEYVLTKSFDSKETFDVIACFDTIHLVKDPKQLEKHLNPHGLLFLSVPKTFQSKMPTFPKLKKLVEMEIGVEEKSLFQLWKKPASK